MGDMNEDRDDPIRLPARPRKLDRAIASDHIDALLRIRGRLEDDESADDTVYPTRYRPASIGSRGGCRLEGPDPICTNVEDAKRYLAALDIAPRRTPCVVSDETGEWQPVWTATLEARIPDGDA